jgi:hypothetical protein
MAKTNSPSPLRWVGEKIVDVVVGTNPKGEPRMLPVRIIFYENVKTGQKKILTQWVAKRPEGLKDPKVRSYIDKQIRRHARRFFG